MNIVERRIETEGGVRLPSARGKASMWREREREREKKIPT